MDVSNKLHAPAALLPGKSPRYPLDMRLGGQGAGVDPVEMRKMSFPIREYSYILFLKIASSTLINL
jgi:hypothetical protein